MYAIEPTELCSLPYAAYSAAEQQRENTQEHDIGSDLSCCRKITRELAILMNGNIKETTKVPTMSHAYSMHAAMNIAEPLDSLACTQHVMNAA